MLVTVEESLFIARPPEVVWDFTQDYRRRTQWDRGIRAAVVVPHVSPPRVHVRAAGGVTCTFAYKQFERPHRSSLAMTDVRSALISGGGGAWTYADVHGGTQWTQRNSLTFKSALLFAVFGALTRRSLSRSTRRAMETARSMIER